MLCLCSSNDFVVVFSFCFHYIYIQFNIFTSFVLFFLFILTAACASVQLLCLFVFTFYYDCIESISRENHFQELFFFDFGIRCDLSTIFLLFAFKAYADSSKRFKRSHELFIFIRFANHHNRQVTFFFLVVVSFCRHLVETKIHYAQFDESSSLWFDGLCLSLSLSHMYRCRVHTCRSTTISTVTMNKK